eukprot:Amastigsp_a1203_22.p2 type:complete len:190 gc:universal Amastigsp_a1203_22:2019-1450(-)
MEHKTYKIAVLGCNGVGKSALVCRFVSGNFLEDYDPTLEDSFRKQMALGSDPAECLLDVLDSSDTRDSYPLQEGFVRWADALICVYSIDCRRSFEETYAFRDHIVRTRRDPSQSAAHVLCANKNDLDAVRQVSRDEGLARAAEFGFSFIETSAKSCYNVVEAFAMAVDGVRSHVAAAETRNRKKKCSLM